MSPTTMGEPTRNASRRQAAADGADLAAPPLLPKGAYAAELHRFSHGAFDATALGDGFIMLPARIILPNPAPEERPAIRECLGGAPDSALLHVSIPLVLRGNDPILTDNGSGDKFQPSAGKLAANPRGADIDPASTTKLVFTHALPGNAGGTVLPDRKLRGGRIDPWGRGP